MRALSVCPAIVVGMSARDGPSRRLVLLVMCVGYFLVLLDVTVVNVALPHLGADLHADVAGLQWVVDGYALALAALLLTGGTLGDVLGHKGVVLGGLAVFGLASAGCGLAPDVGLLTGARVLQGVGAALLLPGTLAVIARAHPEPAERARAIGVWAGVGSVALPAGPLLGGLLVSGSGWRWVFLINVPIVLVAGIVAARVVPHDRGSRARLDWAGTILGAVTLAATTYAVIEAGGHGGVRVWVSGAVAVVAVAAFVRVERRAAHPMLPLRYFGRASFSVANTVAGLMNLGTLGLLFLLTQYLQSVQHRSPWEAGLATIPLFLPLSVLAPYAGRVASRRGPAPVMAFGLVLAAIGVGLVALWRPGTAYPALLPALLCWGLGLAFLTPAVVAAAVGAVPPERSGLASGVNNTARQAGGSIGIAAYGAVAGAPVHAGNFVDGLHITGLATAALWVLAALASVLLVS